MVEFMQGNNRIGKSQSLLFGKLPGAETAERVRKGNGEMVETVRNANGDVLKISVFMDKNGDGRYDAKEAVSVKYFDKLTGTTREYKDFDGDGMCDQSIVTDKYGNETIRKMGKSKDFPDGHDNDLMSMRYGGSWDASSLLMHHMGRALKEDGSFKFE